LSRFELGLVGGQMRDEATVQTFEGLGDAMRVRKDRAARYKRDLGDYSDAAWLG
jgi:hypothetical protein